MGQPEEVEIEETPSSPLPVGSSKSQPRAADSTSEQTSSSARSANDSSLPLAMILNNYPPPTGVWRYACDLTAALRGKSQLATFILGGLDYSSVDASVSPLHGQHWFPQSLSTMANFLFPATFMRSLTRSCISIRNSGGIIHYVCEEIPPWVGVKGCAVTVQSNPIALLETEGYYSIGIGAKRAIRSNLKRYGRGALAVVLTDYVRSGLEQFGFGARIEVIPPAVNPIFHLRRDVQSIRTALGLPMDRKVLLSVSTAELRKNLKVLPKVMDCLPPEYLLVRVGPAVRGAHCLANLTDEEMAMLYSASDALLFPTLDEGYGLPVLEAFASGTPVVSSDIPVIREVAGGKALLGDPNNPERLARLCRDAIDSRSELAEGGLMRARSFSSERLRQNLLKAYALALKS